MKKTKLIALLAGTLLIALLNDACQKDEPAVGIDETMYTLSVPTTGFVWYKKSDVRLAKSSGSGHSSPLFRTRYNDIAATMLDSNGKILAGASFPEGSLIVKELIENDNSISRYAVLYKQSSHASADANGWIWGYINSDGTVAIPASDKGDGCISCHSQSDNIDYMLMNKYFP